MKTKAEPIASGFSAWTVRALWISLRDFGERDRLDCHTDGRQMAAAGYEQPSGPATYVVFRFGLAIGLPVLLLVSQSLMTKPMVGFPLIAKPCRGTGAIGLLKIGSRNELEKVRGMGRAMVLQEYLLPDEEESPGF